ncbi:MAG: glycosyltransferase family 4 protein [Capsulimonadales bacterium]|nr:glycosyltransferase family 4 protein [Capsulimonadales bacterium]
MTSPTYGFIMTQVAGHTAFYRSIRPILSAEPGIRTVWNEVHYSRSGDRLDRLVARLPFLPAHPVNILRAVLDVRQGLRQGPYDALFLNSDEAIFFPERIRRIPTLFYADATPLLIDRMAAYHHPDDGKLVGGLKYRLFRQLVHRVRYVVAWSEWARQSFIEDYGVPPERTLLLPPGLDPATWRYFDRSGRAHRTPRVLFVGGDFERKGGDLLLDWFKRQPTGSCELDVVTRDPVDPHPGMTVHYGMTPNSPALMALYTEADLFILPSRGECFGIATTEAMATGLPVIQTDVGGVRDIIEEGVNGFIIRPNDPDSMDRALQSLLQNRSLRLEMGRAGRDRAEERFNLARNARQILDYLGRMRQ